MTDTPLLPKEFFSDRKKDEYGLLWLPNLTASDFSQKIDWLSGLSLSRACHLDLKTWKPELEQIIEKEELKLDKKPNFNSSTVIFKLPRGFRADMALVVKDCAWDSPDTVFSVYSKFTKSLSPNFIQSPYFWPSHPSQLLKEVQWISL